MGATYDVIIVGAGIAGSALAAQLSAVGGSVLVLEHQAGYRDRVRGETIMPWGVREAQTLGIDEVLKGAGGEYATSFVPYDEIRSPQEAEANALPIVMLAPDVPGSLNVGHPEACEALANHAAACGAEVVRGVGEVQVMHGAAPSVRWANGKGAQEATCRLVVGADGRTSAVRRAVGIELEESEAVTYGAGLLVRARDGHAIAQQNVIGTEADALYLAFPRGDDLARLYLFVDLGRQSEFVGPDRAANFLASYRAPSFPASEAFAAGELAGPCGGGPMTDSWTVGPPLAAGVVLVGDAAGWNDPILGQGLSIALRDARTVAAVLLGGDDWSPPAFDGYVAERTERMRRLAVAARIQTAIRCTFTEEGRERRARWNDALFTNPTALGQLAAALVGPENSAGEVFDDDAVAATLAL